MIFKDPKTDTGNFKRSQKGLCRVFTNEENKVIYEDGFDKVTFPHEKENLLKTVFVNGKMVKEYTLKEVRNNLYGGEF